MAHHPRVVRWSDGTEKVCKGRHHRRAPHQWEYAAFSLTCQECDDEGPYSRAEARAEGWTDITYDDGPSWNFVGICPECYQRENGRKPPRRRLAAAGQRAGRQPEEER